MIRYWANWLRTPTNGISGIDSELSSCVIVTQHWLAIAAFCWSVSRDEENNAL